MGKFSGVLLACDLDDTLLNSDHELDVENIEAAEYFVRNGGSFTVLTGRSLQSGARFFPRLPINAPAGLYNAAVIYDLKKRRVIEMMTLPQSAREFISRLIGAFPEVGLEIATLEHTYLCRSSRTSEDHFSMIGLPYAITDIGDVPDGWLKCNLTQQPSYLAKVNEYLKEACGEQYQAVFSMPYFCEIIRRDAGKGNALLKIARHCGIAREHVYAVGDNYNDADMLKNAAEAFVPSNAPADIRALSSRPMPSNNEFVARAVIDCLEKKYTCGA